MTGREPSLLDQILADFDEMGLELDGWLGDGESGNDYARLVFWAQLFAARRAMLGDLSGYQKMAAYIGAHGLSGPGKHLGDVRAIYLRVQAEWPEVLAGIVAEAESEEIGRDSGPPGEEQEESLPRDVGLGWRRVWRAIGLGKLPSSS